MTGYYEIINTLKNQLIADEFVNTVTEGQIDDIDLRKQEIFPLSHIIVGNCTRPDEGRVLSFDVTVLCMDIVDKNKEEVTDIFLGNDNEQDVLNTQLAVGLRAVEVFNRGSNTANFEIDGDATFEPFTERFENNLAGWAVTFTIHIHNTMTSCDSVAGYNPCAPVSYSIKDDEGTVLYSGQIASGSSLSQVISDADIQFNGTSRFSVNAEGTLDIIPKDSSGDTLTVSSVSGNEVTFDATARETAFVIRINTALGDGLNEFTIITNTGSYAYDYNVETSDGQTFLNQTGNLTISFAERGTYEIKITEVVLGGFPQLFMGGGVLDNSRKIIDFSNWGDNAIKSFIQMFSACQNLEISAKDTPNVSEFSAGNFASFLVNATNFRGNSFIANYDFSNAFSLSSAFQSSGIAVNLSSIDHSSNTSLINTFRFASNFDFNLGSWDISSLTAASGVFDRSGMSTANYTDTIVGWANFVFDNGGSPSGVNMGGQTNMTYDTARSGGANFADAGAARTYLTGTALWTISGDTVI